MIGGKKNVWRPYQAQTLGVGSLPTEGFSSYTNPLYIGTRGISNSTPGIWSLDTKFHTPGPHLGKKYIIEAFCSGMLS